MTLVENKQNDINPFFRLETEFISILQSYNHRSIVILNQVFSFFAEKYFFLPIICFFIFSENGSWVFFFCIPFSVQRMFQTKDVVSTDLDSV